MLRAVFFMPSRAQWAGWKPYTRFGHAVGVVGIFGTLVSVIGLIFTVAWSWYTRPLPSPIRSYDLSDTRRAKFLELLQVTPGTRLDKLRVGCVVWSEESCIAAGEFAKLFSDAGWDIEGNQVFKVDTSVPVKGVSIAARDADILALPRLPLRYGRWASMDMSNQLITSVFRIMDAPVHGASDPTLPDDDTLGIYFGPDTYLYSTIGSSKKSQGEQLIKFVKAGLMVEQSCLAERMTSCQERLALWESEVHSYLSNQDFGNDVTSSWAGLSGTNADVSKDCIDRQLNFLSGLFLLNSGRTFPP